MPQELAGRLASHNRNRDLAGEDGLLGQIGRVPFIPVMTSKRSYAFPAASSLATFPLCAIKDMAAPSLSKVQSLVRPVLHADIEFCPKGLENVLWPVGELDHDGHVVWTIKQLQRLQALLGSREDELLAQQEAADLGQAVQGGDDTVKDSKEERRRNKEKRDLEDMVWDAYRELDRVAEKKMELLNNVDLIRDELAKFPSIFLPKIGSFVRADECFTGLTLSTTVDGVMYAVDGRLEGYPNLIKDLELRATPSRVQLLQMMKKLLCRESGPSTAEACVALLQEAAKDADLLKNNGV